MPPSASILIPTRARASYLRVALASIAPQAAEADAEVLVIDDAGASPATRALVTGFGARYAPHPAPLGLNVARNTGVGSLQPNWIASNPASLHDIVIGTQDNGTIRRAGDTVWRAAFLGDGGGTAFFASATAQYARQYVRASWEDDLGHSWAFVLRAPANLPADQVQENRASSFYSGAAATVDAGITRVAVGTTRV